MHPTGNQFVRHLLEKLLMEDHLALFATTLGFSEPTSWTRWFPSGLAAEIGRRSYRLPVSKLATQPCREIVRLIAGRSGWRNITRHEVGWASVDAVYRSLDQQVATNLKKLAGRLNVGVVYGYEDGCAKTFAAAKDLGLANIYDLPIAYWETSVRLLREEARRWPEWEPTLGATADSTVKLERKTKELKLADVIVCPSDFVADSLPAWVRTLRRVVVVPFGSPCPLKGECVRQVVGGAVVRPPIFRAKTGGRRERLRVLFVGSMSQRKGLADLFAAMRMLESPAIELVVMGMPILPISFYRNIFPNFIHESPRPHAAVLELMRTCDVLVLPSIVEGRALVMQEAMSQGLPIIVTQNTGGADLVEEGVTGFLTPIRAPETLARHLEWMALHQNALPSMGRAAAEKAANYTWDAYARRIIASLPISTAATN